MKNHFDIATTVDRIGALRALIAPYEAELEEHEAKLKALGTGKYKGLRYDSTVSSYFQNRLDMDAVRAKLSPQFIRANTSSSRVVKIQTHAKQLPVKVAA